MGSWESMAELHRERAHAAQARVSELEMALRKILDEDDVMFSGWDHYYDWVRGICQHALKGKNLDD